MTRAPGANRQVKRTRQALLRAFANLIVERGYDRLTVRDIIEGADVGRSTFYEHFDNKEHLLRQSLLALMSVLASAVDEGASGNELEFVLVHFWKSRRLAREMFGGAPRRAISAFLAELIAARLAVRPRDTVEPLLPLDLIAAQLAEGQLGLIGSWVAGRSTVGAPALARALQDGSAAAAAALMGTRRTQQPRGARPL